MNQLAYNRGSTLVINSKSMSLRQFLVPDTGHNSVIATFLFPRTGVQLGEEIWGQTAATRRNIARQTLRSFASGFMAFTKKKRL